MGFLLIRHGYQKVVICGGAQEVNHLCVSSFDSLGAFSKLESAPGKASKPFDINRDGLVPAEVQHPSYLKTWKTQSGGGTNTGRSYRLWFLFRRDTHFCS